MTSGPLDLHPPKSEVEESVAEQPAECAIPECKEVVSEPRKYCCPTHKARARSRRVAARRKDAELKPGSPLRRLLNGERDLGEKPRNNVVAVIFECEKCDAALMYRPDGKKGGRRRVCKEHARQNRGINAYRDHKEACCEACGFEPLHPAQLDVHHKDGDHTNNALRNLTTLCSNCHRLIHHRPDLIAIAA